MRAVYQLNADINLGALAAEVYDIQGIAERLDEAMAALQEANPGLPAGTIDHDDWPFVWLPRMSAFGWRVPPYPDENVRTALEGIGIKDVETLALTSQAFLEDRLPGEEPVDLALVRGVATLMLIPGLDRNTAKEFFDGGIHTIDDLAQADQAALKAIIVPTPTTGILPEAVLAWRPWYYLQQRAIRRLRRRPRRPTWHRVAPTSTRKLNEQMTWWARRATDESLSAAERESAAAISKLYNVGQEVVEGNRLLLRREPTAAYNTLRRAWRLVGEIVEAEGIPFDEGDDVDNKSAPSPKYLVPAIGKILERVRSADCDIARERVGLPLGRTTQGLRAFKYSDLADSTVKGELDTALGSAPNPKVGKADPSVARQIQAGYAKKSFTQVNRSLRYAIQKPTAQFEVQTLTPQERTQFQENVKSVTFAALGDASWTDVRENIELPGLRGTGAAPWTSATDKLTDTAARGLPSALLANMTPMDPFVSWRSKAAPHMEPLHVPIRNSEATPGGETWFAKHYREHVLQPLFESGEDERWNISEEDLLDPAQLAFAIPLMFSRHVPLSLAECLDGMGQPRMAGAARGGLVVRGADLVSELPGFNISRVGSEALVGDVEMDADDLSALHAQLVAINDRADDDYREGRFGAAKAKYLRVRTLASQSTQLVAAPSMLDGGIDILISRVADRVDKGGSHRRPSLADVIIRDPVDPDLAWPLLQGVQPLLSGQSVFTATTAARLGVPQPKFHLTGTLDYTYGNADGQDGSSASDNVDAVNTVAEFLELMAERVAEQTQSGSENDEDKAVFDPNLIEIEVLHASIYLKQLDAGLNYIGLDPDTLPVWSFDHLLSQGRYYAEKADGLQQRFFSLLRTLEADTLQQFEYEQAAALTDQGLEVAKASTALAAAQTDAAEVSRDAAQNAWMRTSDDVMWAVAQGVANTAAAIGASAPDNVGGMVTAAIAGAVNTAAAVDQAMETQEAAADQLKVAESQLVVAEKQEGVALAQETLAAMQATAARGALALLEGREAGIQTIALLTEVTEKVAQSYLRMANRLAWLAERAYAWETRRHSSYIQMNYDRRNSTEARFMGATLLLNHLDALAHERITATTAPYQLIRTSYGLALEAPGALRLLQQTGRTFVRISQKTLDLRFPGLYLHALKRVEVEFDGLLPQGGVHAVLSGANNARVRVPNTPEYVRDPDLVEPDWAYPPDDYPIGDEESPPAFVMKGVNGAGFTQILSEYRRSQDGAVLAPPPGALDAFEHLPPDIVWSLEIPRQGNLVDYGNLSDVRFVLYFTAHYSDRLAQAQRAQLSEPTRSDGATNNTGLEFTSESAQFDLDFPDPLPVGAAIYIEEHGLFLVASVDGPTQVTLAQAAPADLDTLTWFVVVPIDLAAASDGVVGSGTETTLTSATGAFDVALDGFDPPKVLLCVDITGDNIYRVLAFSETTLTLDAPATVGSGLTYRVFVVPTNGVSGVDGATDGSHGTLFSSAGASFLVDLPNHEGEPELPIDLELDGSTFVVSKVIDAQTLRLATPATTSLSSRPYNVWVRRRRREGILVPASAGLPEALEAFVTPPTDTMPRDVRTLLFEFPADRFPPTVRDPRLDNFGVAFLGISVPTLKVRVASTHAPFGANILTNDPSLSGREQMAPGTVYSGFADNEAHMVGTTVVQAPRAGNYPDLDAIVATTHFTPESGVSDWLVKVLPEGNPAFELLDDDGDPLEVPTGELRLEAAGGWASYAAGSGWTHAEALVAVALAKGTFTLTLREGGTPVHAEIDIGAEEGGTRPVTVRILEDSTEKAAAGPFQVVLDPVYRIGLRVYGAQAEVRVDGLRVLAAAGLVADPGTVKVEFADGDTAMHLYDVRVNRLRHDGTVLEEVVYETWSTTDAWTRSGTGAVRDDTMHKLLDLSSVRDVLFTLEYSAAHAFTTARTVVEPPA